MADGISILTNVTQVVSASKVQQGQQPAAEAQDQANKAERGQETDAKAMSQVKETEETSVQARRDEARRRRQKKKKRKRKAQEGRSSIDIKA